MHKFDVSALCRDVIDRGECAAFLMFRDESPGVGVVLPGYIVRRMGEILCEPVAAVRC